MKTDFVTYVTKMLVKQHGLNIIFTAAIVACLSKIASLNAEVKILKSEAEGESD